MVTSTTFKCTLPDGSHRYLELKLAHELYRKAPAALALQERRHVVKVAARQFEIEERILATPEAACVQLSESTLAAGMAEISGRYPERTAFLADLERNHLTEAVLSAAIRRTLVVDAVLDGIASHCAPASDSEVENFYLAHERRFRRPRLHTLRQILVTINDALPGSDRPSALARIQTIQAQLSKAPEQFAALALAHSECPSATNGGLLGDLPRGKLYPELELAGFTLMPGEISGIIETELGYHLLRCDAIQAETKLPLSEVRERIRSHLQQERRKHFQKAWIAWLFHNPIDSHPSA